MAVRDRERVSEGEKRQRGRKERERKERKEGKRERGRKERAQMKEKSLIRLVYPAQARNPAV